jgi:predicted AAA+ superfamily ATPase
MEACAPGTLFGYDESDTIEGEFGTIEVLPVWKWLLQE